MWILRLGILFICIKCLACKEHVGNKKENTSYRLIQIDTTDINTIGMGFPRLSDYGFFKGNIKLLQPAENVFSYALNATLFSDYALKKRFLYLPPDKEISMNKNGRLIYPEGSYMIKNFYYYNTDNEVKLIETRLLHRQDNDWNAVTYVWNDEQTEAYFYPYGLSVAVYNHVLKEGFIYDIPDINQCKNCHYRNGVVEYIGPTAENLYKATFPLNAKREVAGVLEDHRLIDYNDESHDLNRRARSYLDINCGSCHSPWGSARTSGLDLTYGNEDPYSLGINKPPIAAGKASGGRLYDIVAGNPDASILVYRLENDDPAIRMPEIGRKLAHKEGISLIKDWITSL